MFTIVAKEAIVTVVTVVTMVTVEISVFRGSPLTRDKVEEVKEVKGVRRVMFPQSSLLYTNYCRYVFPHCHV